MPDVLEAGITASRKNSVAHCFRLLASSLCRDQRPAMIFRWDTQQQLAQSGLLGIDAFALALSKIVGDGVFELGARPLERLTHGN